MLTKTSPLSISMTWGLQSSFVDMVCILAIVTRESRCEKPAGHQGIMTRPRTSLPEGRLTI